VKKLIVIPFIKIVYNVLESMESTNVSTVHLDIQLLVHHALKINARINVLNVILSEDAEDAIQAILLISTFADDFDNNYIFL